jgi:hypothetical protein
MEAKTSLTREILSAQIKARNMQQGQDILPKEKHPKKRECLMRCPIILLGYWAAIDERIRSAATAPAFFQGWNNNIRRNTKIGL